jgi:glutamate N-acetyltransferase/amino-acid N-acetyltransferase
MSAVPTSQLTFSSEAEHRAWLDSQSVLPRGFRVGTARLSFVPVEVHKPSRLTLTLICLDRPTPAFAAMFTRNAFPGAPIVIGRARLSSPTLGAILVNNKVANVCAPGGIEAAERISAALAPSLGLTADQVLPCSTGVIGWRLPVEGIIGALAEAVSTLQSESVLPAAEGIMTTDLYPKVRCARVGDGTIVGIAKGAGMIEPNLATLLVYLLTDLDISRDALRSMLGRVVDATFHAMTIDTDTSTSDTVALLASRRVPCSDLGAFESALSQVCSNLCEDIVRNGEGVHHVVRVDVRGAPTLAFARGVGKAIVSSPLVQCAICGNDPNVGRLLMAIGKFAGTVAPDLDLSGCSIRMGGQLIFARGALSVNEETERMLIAHLSGAELYASVPPPDGLSFRPPVRFPPHERAVEISVDLNAGSASAAVIGTDRSHEYITENADYRS